MIVSCVIRKVTATYMDAYTRARVHTHNDIQTYTNTHDKHTWSQATK